jgi:uncharacterized protein YraI
MKLKTLAIGALLAAATAVPGIAQAATWFGYTTGAVNMRYDATTAAPKVLTLPGGAKVSIDGQKNGWYHVYYAGQAGFVSGSYITTRVAMAPRSLFRNRGMEPQYGYMQKPWWDNQHEAWYDGHRWYRNGTWYNQPQGLSFGFSFGG